MVYWIEISVSVNEEGLCQGWIRYVDSKSDRKALIEVTWSRVGTCLGTLTSKIVTSDICRDRADANCRGSRHPIQRSISNTRPLVLEQWQFDFRFRVQICKVSGVARRPFETNHVAVKFLSRTSAVTIFDSVERQQSIDAAKFPAVRSTKNRCGSFPC